VRGSTSAKDIIEEEQQKEVQPTIGEYQGKPIVLLVGSTIRHGLGLHDGFHQTRNVSKC